MASNRRPFNIFAAEMPFVLPQPIPEPPRVINPRPMVPDLSITSDPPINGQPYQRQLPQQRPQHPLHGQQQQYRDNSAVTDKWRTAYPMPNRSQSPPKPSPPLGGRRLATDLLYANANQIEANFAATHHLMQMTANRGVNNDNNGQHFGGRRTAFADNTSDANVMNKNPKNVFTNGRLVAEDNNKQLFESRNTGKPRIVRHQTSKTSPQEPLAIHQNRQRLGASPTVTKTTNGCPPTNCVQNEAKTPTSDEMLAMIRQQDFQLQRISEQIQELLSFHRINDQKVDDISKRSVQTMTSLVLENNENITPLTHRSSRKGVHNSTKSTPSTATRDLRALRLNTISEGVSEPSDIELDSRRLNFSDSPVRRRDNSSSVEMIRRNDSHSDSYDNHFYGRVLNDIEVMLKNDSTVDETTDNEDSGRRSSCSPTPPHSRRRSPLRPDQRREHHIEIQSEQTLYIKRMAAKYLVNDEPIRDHKTTKPKHRVRTTTRGDDNHQRHDWRHTERQQTADCLDVYGMTKNASIATKNYLEKYGLTYSPPRVVAQQQDLFAGDYHQHRAHHHKSNGRHKQQLFNRNKILDIEALRRQPKLT